MPPETKEPTAGTVGEVEGSGERSTEGAYAKRGSWEPFKRVREALAAADRSEIPPIARLVGLEIGGHLDPGGYGFVSVARICRRTGLGSTAVQNALRVLTTGPGRLFNRTAGGARSGARYTCSEYSIRDLEGLATRGARETRGSSGGVEGSVSRRRGVRLASSKDQLKDQLKGYTHTRARDGRLLDEIACPSCGRFGFLTQSPGRGGNPPGWWCRNTGGCGFNFPLNHGPILEALTPGARKAIEDQISKTQAPPTKGQSTEDAIAEGIRRAQERGVILGGAA